MNNEADVKNALEAIERELDMPGQKDLMPIDWCLFYNRIKPWIDVVLKWLDGQSANAKLLAKVIRLVMKFADVACPVRT